MKDLASRIPSDNIKIRKHGAVLPHIGFHPLNWKRL